MSTGLEHVSKRLSHALRHDPGRYGLTLDAAGWGPVAGVLTALVLTPDQLDQIVDGTDARRFAYDTTRTRIRALHGHSIPVTLGLSPVTPPTVLFHGTAVRFLAQIRQNGLIPMSRNQVHLVADKDRALQLGSRHGTPTVLTVDAQSMFNNGRSFYRAENGVWLTDSVPVCYLDGGLIGV